MQSKNLRLDLQRRHYVEEVTANTEKERAKNTKTRSYTMQRQAFQRERLFLVVYYNSLYPVSSKAIRLYTSQKCLVIWKHTQHLAVKITCWWHIIYKGREEAEKSFKRHFLAFRKNKIIIKIEEIKWIRENKREKYGMGLAEL